MYASIVWALSFSVTVDGVPVASPHFDGVYGCCNSSVDPAYNVEIFDIQGLPLANHEITLQLTDTYGYLFDGNGSELRFDYAVVNETGLVRASGMSLSFKPQ
jgi:hypothetical protein